MHHLNDILLWAAAGGAVLAFLAAMLAWLRPPAADARLEALLEGLERTERALRADIAEGQRGLRGEFSESARALRAELAQSQEELRAGLSRDAQAARAESAESLARFGAGFSEQLQGLIQINERRLMEVRATVDQRLQSLQSDNSAKLDEMRRTVDEKLHATLEQRLGESFKLVSDRLEAVHKGLGEMQALAAGVGDLKRVLTNVKSRGTWGEVQLARLIEDNMTPDQYASNIKPVPGSDAVVEFAIRLPGRGDGGAPVWLPIDAKFPKEEYERLMDAQDAADAEGAKNAGAALGRAVELQARSIAAKYVAPPHTTDFAIMFLPTESLYAEVLRRPGLLDKLHDLRVNVAGPSNLAALLNSLQMGFRTLAIEQRSSEVWQVLRAVKTEFGKFGDALASVKKTLDTASNKIGQTEVRTRAMLRNLKDVEALPEADARLLLGEGGDDPGEPEAPPAGAN
ncbi:DNA recombination protein RmuC [Achromobacter denitrificans]|jgi:DNA recombination protein RmuC|uniref:DNA recombination protein RmuC n=1 Tax=Achromobacter denitrificans TaxID=32002 RepID=A0A427WL46_ACHDE|nr:MULTISPECIES: DNA recombination protein RmuC [Achromobacter]MBV2160214.1 DNA recombination protein RmuC [Achromobacter denitrificans]MDF3857830.1 DNA recombination protein RmuC [Achromobacter denitrificans]MDF3941928.1 DNA recombination protein RmuC [Achromobacter denitrificans]MDX3879808.1 DNA recombination protein RmuC [Achromobacter sp.]OLU08309.1 recombinase RmuC [Achromobacter denitrificans]